MKKEDIYKISINYLIKEKIKQIEIKKNMIDNKVDLDETYLSEMIKSTYTRNGYKNLQEFENHINKFGVNISDIKNKISIESLWNELIYKKFSTKIIIDKTELRKKVIEENNKEIKSFNLSEIVFKISEGQNLNKKFESIKKDINEKGFTNAALMHSISNTSVNGGELGWITEGSLNSKIKKKIINLKIGSFTNPLIIPGGFLIIKLNEIKNEKKKYDIEKKLNEFIRNTTNQQLGQLSNIYYDKIKKEIKINEL